MIDKIYRTNCLTWMKKQRRGIIDLTVTSPPYDNLRSYKGYSFEFEKIARQLFRLTKKGGVLVWVVTDGTVKGGETGTSFKQALYFKKCGFVLHDTMIYEKNTSSFPAGSKSNRYTQIFEYMFVFSKGKPKTANLLRDKLNRWGGHPTSWGKALKRQIDGSFDSYGTGKGEVREFGARNNIWKYVCSGGFGQSDKLAYKHPATFPEKLAEDHVLTWSNEDDLVFDPFAGSGTTLLMARKNNRRYIGCEISREYHKLIVERLSQSHEDTIREKKVEKVCSHCHGNGYVFSNSVRIKKPSHSRVSPLPAAAIPSGEAFGDDIKVGNQPIPPELLENSEI